MATDDSAIEAIAIIGMAGRFPGAQNIHQFWHNVRNGVESRRVFTGAELSIPAEIRAHPHYVNSGFVLDDIDLFDAEFFDISPRQAQLTDPQQRVFLECAWEALEDSGINPDTYAGLIGLYAGANMSEYIGLAATQVRTGVVNQLLVRWHNDKDSLTTHTAYKLNIKGPCVTVQTACSTSLVAVHMAAQSLLNYECDVALAGGVTIRVPHYQGYIYEEGAIFSPDGHCRTFDARAQGTVFGNGVGVVVLKRLSDALADRDHIWAVMKGSAVNNDGSQKIAFSAPSVAGQRDVITEALSVAAVDPESIGYVEAHGTGTPIGDPIEVTALTQAFGTGSGKKGFCALGAVKTNIGHAGSAAGIASLIKTVLALTHRELPPSLHFRQPNPEIDFANSPFYVNTRLNNWPTPGQPRRAGVSSFGVGGTNAHVILEEAPQNLPGRPEHDRPAHVLTLSGKTAQALADQVRRYGDYLSSQTALNPAAVCYTTNVGRGHFAHRLVVVADDRAALSDTLAAYHPEHPVPGLVTGQARAEPPNIAFLFPGQGPQYVDMGRELYETHPLFRQIMTECDAILYPWWGKSLLDMLYGEDKAEHDRLLDEATYAQPALFALEYALAKLWQSWGVAPEVVIGHSMGEYAAACFAGVFSLADGLKLIAERGRLMQTQTEAGQMVAVLASAAEVAPLIAPFAGEVSIGVINTPHNVVISGRSAGVQQAVDVLQAAGLKIRTLKIYVASHSPLMDRILDAFEAVVREVALHRPRIKVTSNLTGTIVSEELTRPAYWRDHLRQSVQFARGMATLADLGINTFIEVGPKPTLLGLGQQCLPDADERAWLPSLYPAQARDWTQLLTSLGHLYVRGAQIDWSAFHAPYPRAKVSLPTYPFQRKRYWVDTPGAGYRSGRASHPLLGEQFQSPTTSELHFVQQLSADYPAYLRDHQVYAQVVFPAAAYLEMALQAGGQITAGAPARLQHIVFQHPLVFPADGREQQVHLVLTPTAAGYQWRLFSREAEDAAWQLHAQGMLAARPEEAGAAQVAQPGATLSSPSDALVAIQQRCPEEVSLRDYEAAIPAGLVFGPDFQGISRLFRGEQEALGLIRLPDNLSAAEYYLHPVLLDCCLRVGGILDPAQANGPYLPFSCDQVRLYTTDPLTTVWSHVRQRGDIAGTRQADITLFDLTGQVVATLTGFGLSPANRQAITGSNLRADWLYHLQWVESPLPRHSPYAASPGRWLIVAAQVGQAEPLAALLQAQGADVILVSSGDRVGRLLAHDSADPMHLRGVIYLAATSSTDPIPEQAFTNVAQATAAVQGLLAAGVTPDVWFVTSAAPEQAAVWGLGRTLWWEHPQFNCRCVEMQPEVTVKTLFETIWYADEENQLRPGPDQRQIARLERYRLSMPDSRPYPFRVQLGQYGLLDSLELIAAPRHAPGARQVEVEVRAVGLNFMDVLNALGMLQSYATPAHDVDTLHKLLFGSEASGVVCRVGEEVTDYQVGDEVIVWGHFGCLASFITVDRRQIGLKPAHFSFEAAATIPITFMTAYYGLRELAQMKAGDRVLIHAAAGGVGQAAVQLARAVGAEVYATASPPKWDYLRSQGIEHVMNSRTLEFAGQLLEQTSGQGVDIVLNSLNGAYIPKNFDVLAKNGRFVEMSKIDIWDKEQANNYRPDVAYLPFDLMEVSQDKKCQIQERLSQLFATRQLEPLPHHIFSIDQVGDSFQFMSQARHIGKIVLAIPDQETAEKKAIQPGRSYLITGGLGGLGLQVAEWLVAQGATHLVLSSRRETETSRQVVADLTARGATVQVVTADISHPDEVARLLAVSQDVAPLKGIIHAAGLLDDGIIRHQTAERLARVFAPKVQGSWYLHTQSRHIPLDFFVCFSSQAALLGSGGQSNYAAANAFMDALMHQRRAMGLPGVSINWGGWAEVGLAGDRMTNRAEAITPHQGVAFFGALLGQATPQAGVIPVNWAQFGTPLPAPLPFLSNLITQQPVAPTTTLGHQVRQVPPEEQYRLVRAHIAAELERVLGTVPDDTEEFFDRGMDSLTAIQLTSRLATALNTSLPATTVLQYPTIAALTRHLLDSALAVRGDSVSHAIRESRL
jgi:acyl transferase domain-containing protein/acyl carrier protein